MGQSAAGSSAEHIRVPGDLGGAASHFIFFCEQCGLRVPSGDLVSHKARLLDESRAVCAACSHKRSSATAALKPADGSTRRSTRQIAPPRPSEARASEKRLAPATHAHVRADYEPVTEEHHERKKPNLLLPVGLALAVAIVICVGVILARRSNPLETASANRTPEKVAPPVVTPMPNPPAVVANVPASKVETKPVLVDGSKDVPPQEEYDPRGAVAASMLAEAKAQKGTAPEDLLEYKSRLERIRDGYARTPAAVEAERLLGELKSLPPVQDLLDTIPDAKDYRLVYDLNLSKLGGSITYDRDERTNITQPFDRIAYLLELKPRSGSKQWVFVSMEAFTDDLGKIGIPTVSSQASFQQNVTNLNVASNVDSIVAGTGLTGGNIEFWPNNYGPWNATSVPNASNDKYDFGDQKSQPENGHGCMQVHNYDAKQTIFAINQWRQGGNGVDLGIGNRPKDHPDWTFSNSGGSYSSKRLRVLVHLK